MSKFVMFPSQLRGDTIKIRFRYFDDNGDPYSLYGWTSFFTLKDEIDGDPIFESIETNIINGVVIVVIPNSETNDFVGQIFFDHQLVRTVDTKVITPFYGIIPFNKDVTRRVV